MPTHFRLFINSKLAWRHLKFFKWPKKNSLFIVEVCALSSVLAWQCLHIWLLLQKSLWMLPDFSSPSEKTWKYKEKDNGFRDSKRTSVKPWHFQEQNDRIWKATREVFASVGTSDCVSELDLTECGSWRLPRCRRNLVSAWFCRQKHHHYDFGKHWTTFWNISYRKHQPQSNQPEFFLSEHNAVLSVAASIAAGLGLQRRQQLPPGVPLWRGDLWPVRQLQPDQGGLPGVGTRHLHARCHPTGHNPPRPVLQCHGPPEQHHVSWSRLHHPGQPGSQQQSYNKGQWRLFFFPTAK